MYFLVKIKRFLGKLWRSFYRRLVINLSYLPVFPNQWRHVSGAFLERRYKQRVVRFLGTAKKIEHIRQVAISNLERYVQSQKPNLDNIDTWIQAHRSMFRLATKRGDYSLGQQVTQRLHQGRTELIDNYALDHFDIEFIPRDFAFASIGRYGMIVAYIRAQLLGLVPEKKKLLLAPQGTKYNNASYLSYFEKYIQVITDPDVVERLAPLEEKLTTPLSPIFPPINDNILGYYTNIGRLQQRWDESKRSPLLTIDPEHDEKGKTCLRTLGMPDDAWFVALHVREPGWTEAKPNKKGFRDSYINQYDDAIKAVTDKGGWVIRLGNPSMTPLPSMDKVIDYAHSEHRSDWMDVFLCAQCRFFIGTSSGMYTLAEAFGVPKVMLNLIPGQAMFAMGERDIVLPKLLKSREDGRLLSLRELFSPPVAIADTQYFFDTILNVDVIDNEPDEIKDAVEHMMAKLDGDNVDHDEDSDLFRRCQQNINEWAQQDYQDPSLCMNATIGRLFLKRHQALVIEKALH